MRILAGRIDQELQQQKVCAVYNSDLSRLWPPTMDPEKRKREIATFAQKFGLEVSFLEVGLCAIFEKKKRKSRSRTGAASRGTVKLKNRRNR